VSPRTRGPRGGLGALPSVDRVLGHPVVEELLTRAPRPVVADAVRAAVAARREAIRRGADAAASADLESIAREAAERARARLLPSLRPVINATGVILHTNLGRAPLPEAAVEAVAAAARRYVNLELDLATGARGSRMTHLAPLLCEVLGAKAALAVNNNAAALLLALRTFAAGREAVVSRGELVEIGGSFRIPEILEQAGVRLREVGTTNKTRLSDYERAIGPATALLLRIHPSNFAQIGFTERVPRPDLVRLARRRRVLLLEDVGSGALIDLTRFGLPEEPLARDALRDGVPLVSASADKLLGGPQAGILAGAKRLVDAAKRNPRARALRLDKLSIAALEATLRLYRDPAALAETVPALRMLTQPPARVRARARRVLSGLGQARASQSRAEVVACRAEAGGGSLPLAHLPSFAVALRPASGGEALARALRTGPEPVLGRVVSGRLLLDLRTVPDRDVPALVRALARVLDEEPPTR
jgi:L-seryl-tRNA(Ser) seleniumtransferase